MAWVGEKSLEQEGHFGSGAGGVSSSHRFREPPPLLQGWGSRRQGGKEGGDTLRTCLPVVNRVAINSRERDRQTRTVLRVHLAMDVLCPELFLTTQ